MAYTNEDLERMKRSLGITDDELREKIENPVIEFPELNVSLYKKHVIGTFNQNQYCAENDAMRVTPQDNVSSLVSSCLTNFGPVAFYANEVPDTAETESPLIENLPLSEDEYKNFWDLFNNIKNKYY